MAADLDKTVEILVSDVGELTLVLRPSLPFLAEGYRVQGGSIEIFGQGEKVSLAIPEEARGDVDDISQALLLEFPRSGALPERETDLLKS